GAGIKRVMFDRNRFVFPNSVYWDAAQNKYVDNTNITVAEGGPNYWSLSSTRTGMNENYVTSGAFWKLRELALSYELPAKLWNFKVVKGATISLVGRNLIMLVPKTNVYTDPEYSDAGTGNYVGLNSMSQNPPNRYYGGTITLKF
ncbi:MAG TPA: SusC/RagA family TonB-linked outer membrane protein, partial [Niabella sp.]|nr:SusC/RagA family TonB-linked outer membrane protein [Niabella sp.]